MSNIRGENERTPDAVRRVYSAAALRPDDEHPFPVGRRFAVDIGYPCAMLSILPAAAVEAFSGVSNVSCFADIPPRSTVLDLGCGAGLDSLVAAGKVGPEGCVIGVDFSIAMLARARQAAAECATGNIQFCHADAGRLPIVSGSIDVALVNGIFNLNPGREAIFRELARVVRSGGSVYAAELILKEPLPAEVRNDASSWFA